jgi:hypothetical protein
MLRRVGAFGILIAVSGTCASAADLPEIMARPGNMVPACVTPGRLMLFLKQRNPDLNPRYDGIATQYMRFGEQLGVRWDYAFYQMVVETGALSYWHGRRPGDVRPEQNNFAGLGATGGGERGESFKDIAAGVRAHLEHVRLYAGHPVANPIAERTRKVQEWGILASWQQSFGRPITYADLGAKWAPGSRSYLAMLRTVAGRFEDDLCHKRDPRPELVQEARALIADAASDKPNQEARESAAAVAKTADAAPSVLQLGAELVHQVFEPKAERTAGRSALGAPQAAEEAAAPSAPDKVLGGAPATPQQEASAAPAGTAAPAAGTSAGTASAPSTGRDAHARTGAAANAGAGDKTGSGDGRAGTHLALAGTAATAGPKTKPVPDTALPPAANQQCRVWTASYGGQKSIIIRSVADRVVNFTVLDVNMGSEKREAEAFIAAYAKNGKVAGEYPNQAQALDKAFELCPEG